MHYRHHIFLLTCSLNSKDSMTRRQCGKGILCFIKNFQNFVGFRFPDNYNSIISPFSLKLQFLFWRNIRAKQITEPLPSKGWKMVGSSLCLSFQGDSRDFYTIFHCVCQGSREEYRKIQGHAGIIIPHCNGRLLKAGSKWAPALQLNSMVWCGFGWKYPAYSFSISADIKTVEYLQLIGSFRSGIRSRLLSSLPPHHPRGKD